MKTVIDYVIRDADNNYIGPTPFPDIEAATEACRTLNNNEWPPLIPGKRPYRVAQRKITLVKTVTEAPPAA